MKYLLKSKLKAAALHFALSITIAGSALALAAWAWYPTPLISPTGATKIFLLVLSVDICLGPFLTLIVFNEQKKGLRGDLLVIGLIQIGALFYGVYTLANARPVYIVYAVDRFEVVQANDLAKSDIADAMREEFKTLPVFGPKWISTRVPTADEQSIGIGAALGAADIAQLPKLYSNLETSSNMRVERAKSMAILKEQNPQKLDLINSLINHYKSKEQQIAFVPLTTRKKDLTVILNAQNGDALKIVDLNPWTLADQ